MADFDTQINVGMNVDGVVSGTEKAKRSLKDLSSSARDSGKSVEGMGDGGAKAADKVEAATRSMVNSIQRQIAATEAGDKSSRKYQESLANLRGVDSNALKPYLDQLDAAKLKAAQAAGASDSFSSSLGKIQSAALIGAAALTTFAVAFKKINDGVDALNDLKDATGASIENISALEDVALRTGSSFDTVSTSLIKLNQGLNAAKPGSDTESAIKAIGLSVKDLKALDPAEAFRQIAVNLSGFADDANKARLVQELFGKSLKEVAPLLKDLAEKGQLNATVTTAQAEEAEKFNKQLFNLQKNITDVGRAFTSELLPGLNASIERFLLAKKNAGSLLETLALFARLDYGKNIQGNLGDVEKQIAQLEERATRITSAGAMRGNDKMIADLKAQAEYLKELRQLKILAEQGDNSDAVSRRFTRDRPTLNLPDQSAAKDAAARGAKALAEQNRELEKEAALLATLSGFNADYEEQLGRLGRIREKGNISVAEYVKLVTELNAKQPAIKSNMEAEAKAAALIEKANMAALESRQKYVASLGAGVDKLQQETAGQQEYIDRLGLSKEAVAALDAAKLESQAVILDLIAIKELDKNLDEEQYDLYKKQSAELRKQAALKIQGSTKEAQLEIEKEITAERQRGWEETDRLARDVFTTWATEGGNAAQKIGDTLKKALLSAVYEATLKPLVMQVYTSIVGGAPGTAGGRGLPSATGGGSSAFGSGFTGTGFAGSVTSGVESLGEMFINSGSETLNGVGSTLLNNSSQIGQFAATAGTALSYLNAIDLWSRGQRGAAAGAAIGTAVGGPIGAAIGQAIGGLLDYKLTDKGGGITATIGGATGLPSGSVGMYNEFEQTGGLFGGGTTINRDWSVADQGVATYITKSVQAITASNRAYADALGLTSDGIDSFTKNIEVSLTGLDAAGQKKAIDDALSTFEAEQAAASYGDALNAVARDGETTAQTLQRLGGDFTTVNNAFKALGYELIDVGVKGADAASKLAQAFGGLGNFQAQTAALYQNFYSPQEQKAASIGSVQSELAAVGVYTDASVLSNASRQDWRDFVDSFKGGIGTEAGDKQYAAVVKAANALSTFVPAWEQAAAAKAAPVGATSSGGGYTAPSVADAANDVVSAWQDAADAIIATMTDIRLSSLETGADSFTKLKAQFAVEIAQASAGDLAAMQDLPELAQALENANKENAKSAVDQALFTSYILESLGRVSGAGAPGPALTAPNYTGVAAVSAIAPVPIPVYIPPSTGGGTPVGSGAVFERMEQRLAAIEASNEKLRKLLFDVTEGGRAMQTEAYS